METLNPPVATFGHLEKAAETATKKKFPLIVIAIPSANWQIEMHTSEMIRLLINQVTEAEFHVRFMFNDGVARSRNNLVAMALEVPGATHIWFIDSDIVPSARIARRMIAAGKGIIGALYPKKQGMLDWVVNYVDGERPDANGVLKVKHIGTGCMLIDLDVIREQQARHPELLYRGDPGPDTVRYDLFPMRAVDGAYQSEDWAFCNRLREDGYELFIDTLSQCRHVGKIVYPLQFTLSDEEVIDLLWHRYGMWPDQIKSFIASGPKEPGIMGGHLERSVRLWPESFAGADQASPDFSLGWPGVPDLFCGGILEGSLDIPVPSDSDATPPTVLDLGAGVGAFARFAVGRWPGCTVICVEADEAKGALIDRIVSDFSAKGHKLRREPLELRADNVAAFPLANVLKIDLPGSERAIITAYGQAGRLGEIESLILRCSDMTESFLITKFLETTHRLHCWQRCEKGGDILKFMRKDPEPQVVIRETVEEYEKWSKERIGPMLKGPVTAASDIQRDGSVMVEVKSHS